MRNDAPGMPIPLPLLMANIFGMVMIAAGVMAFQSPGVVSGAGGAAVAWVLIGAGALIESGAAQGTVIALRDARSRQHVQGLAASRNH